MVVELLGKLECPLCEEAKDTLLSLRRELSFELRERDVRSDAALWERYRYEVPVVLLDGRELCRHRVDEAAIAALRARSLGG
jgi:glutaredoxin